MSTWIGESAVHRLDISSQRMRVRVRVKVKVTARMKARVRDTNPGKKETK